MSQDVKVSVIVVTYNQERTIGRALESILRQKAGFSFEIIIGDDASTDNTKKICRQYAADYPHIIRLIENTVNKGVKNNYYNCILQARGEYIADLAGDDFWTDDEKLKRQVKILDENQDVVLTHTDWDYFNEETGDLKSPWLDEKYPYGEEMKRGELTKELLRHKNPVIVHSCTSMYRRRVFDELYGEEPLWFTDPEIPVEDLQLMVLFSIKGKFHFEPFKTLAYSIGGNSLTGCEGYEHNYRLYSGILKLTCRLGKRCNIPLNEYEEGVSKMAHFLMMQTFYLYDKKKIENVKALIDEYEIPLRNKTHIIHTVTHMPLLWKLALTIKRSGKINRLNLGIK